MNFCCDGIREVVHSYRRHRVISAAKQNGAQALQSAGRSCRSDRQIVMAAVKQNGRALWYADASLRADRDVVMAAVSQDWRALGYAAEALQADRSIVMAALRQQGLALKYAAQSLRSDKEIVLAAVRQHGIAFVYTDGAIRADKEVLMTAMETFVVAFNFAAEALRYDDEVVAAALNFQKSDLHIWGFNVTTLSGNSCRFVWGSSTPDYPRQAMKEEILRMSAQMLSLDEEIVRSGGELLHAQTVTPFLPDDEALWTLGVGEMHELQLIVCAA